VDFILSIGSPDPDLIGAVRPAWVHLRLPAMIANAPAHENNGRPALRKRLTNHSNRLRAGDHLRGRVPWQQGLIVIQGGSRRQLFEDMA